MGACVVRIVGDRLFRLRDRRAPLVLALIDQTLTDMGRRIVGLNGQGRVDRLFRARDVAAALSSAKLPARLVKAAAEAHQRLHIIRIKRKRALEQRDGLVDAG